MFCWRYGALLIVVIGYLQPAVVIGVKVNFERFEQYFGEEYADFALRVRKFNRTTMTLNGTIHVNQPMDDMILFQTDVFLSRLGNQQFQHYPMHLPTSGICEFWNHLHNEYPTTVASVTNAPEIDECPVSVRTMDIIDLDFPMEVVPESLSSGLWKLVISGTVNETVIMRFMISVRLADDWAS
uniref:Uncharacterized protein n=1 Tax=Anopheles farauti TaxID=69004 RepID=A0A182QLL5_9DIPT